MYSLLGFAFHSFAKLLESKVIYATKRLNFENALCVILSSTLHPSPSHQEVTSRMSGWPSGVRSQSNPTCEINSILSTIHLECFNLVKFRQLKRVFDSHCTYLNRVRGPYFRTELFPPSSAWAWNQLKWLKGEPTANRTAQEEDVSKITIYKIPVVGLFLVARNGRPSRSKWTNLRFSVVSALNIRRNKKKWTSTSYSSPIVKIYFLKTIGDRWR